MHNSFKLNSLTLYFAHNCAHEYKEPPIEANFGTPDNRVKGSHLSVRQISLVVDHRYLNQEKSLQNLV